jgi:hypothetical protein
MNTDNLNYISIEKVVPVYLPKDKITVWSNGGIPVKTEISKIIWNVHNICWRYYFIIEGKEWWEVECAITKTIE